MDKKDARKNIDRKILSDYNMDEQEMKHIQENLRYLGFPNSNSNPSGENDLPSQEKLGKRRKRKFVAEKENIPRSIEVKGAPISTRKTTEVKQKEYVHFVYEPTEGKALKRRILKEMSENHSSPEAPGTDLMKAPPVMKTTQDKSPASANGYPELPPDLSDLILKPKKDKICRPPNAFMLFAKEQRRRIGMEHPNLKNGEISHTLGAMWRDMSDEDKQKYYHDSQALQKLHKETFPDYVYSPSEARLRKQIRTENKLKSKQAFALRLNKSTSIDGKPAECKNDKKPQGLDMKSAQSLIVNNEKEIRNKTPKQLFSEMQANSSSNPFESPLYFPRDFSDKGMLKSKYSVPCCSCPNHAYDNFFLNKNYSHSLPMEKGPSSSTSNSSFPAIANPLSQSYHNLFANNFHPAVWNPWIMWPDTFYNPVPSQNPTESNLSHSYQYPSTQEEKSTLSASYHKIGPNAKIIQPSSSTSEQNCWSKLQHSGESKDDISSSRLADENFDDEIKPLVIDDDIVTSCDEEGI